jgi:hypothetical protein
MLDETSSGPTSENETRSRGFVAIKVVPSKPRRKPMSFWIWCLLLTIAVAVSLLVIRVWLRQNSKIDPESEEFYVNGRLTAIEWRPYVWTPGRVGISTRSDGFRVPAPPTKKYRFTKQELILVRYRDYIGENAASMNLDLECHHSVGASYIWVAPTGLWSTHEDGACVIDLEYDKTTKVLHVSITQWFHHKRIAKKAELLFAFDGERFRFVDSPQAVTGGIRPI